MKKEVIELVQRAQAGDENAFQSVYQTFYNQAYATAFKYCKNDADAKDVVQDVFVTIHRALPDLKNPEIFDFWMTRIIRSKCLNTFRKNKIIYMDDEQLKVLPNKYEERKEYLPYESNAEETEKKLIRMFVQKLSPGQQDCVNLFYFEQKNLEEISNYLKISVGTVKSRLFAARKTLKRHIKDYERSEGVHVSFKVGAATGMISLSLAKRFASKLHLVKDQVIANSAAMNTVVVMNVASVALGVGVIAYGGTQAYQSVEEQWMQKETVSQAFVSEEKLPSYPPVLYKEKNYTSPKSMYYALIPWIAKAENPTKEEVKAMKKMYDVIKLDNGVYWRKLVNGKWDQMFESLAMI